MSRPFMNEIKQSVEQIDTFKGLDRRTVIAEGRFSAMKNMSARKYPLLSTRAKRGVHEIRGADNIEGNITGLISKEKLICTKGRYIYSGVSDEWIDLGLDPTTQKELISFGSYVIILPDKKYYNYADREDRGDIEAKYVRLPSDGRNVTAYPCRADGSVLSIKSKGAVAPTNPENGDTWLDTSGEKPVMKQYSSYSMSWVVMGNIFVRLSCDQLTGDKRLGDVFRKGDSITVTVSDVALKIYPGLKVLNGSFVVSEVVNDGIGLVIPLLLDQSYQFTGITVERKMPKLDFIVESGNRLWGCFYGEGADGKRLNEIYSSALGDFRNWNAFQGVATDSYAASVGSDGRFTGAVSYRGSPYFFKENVVHRVMGSQPSSYQIASSELDGVGEGCGGSLAVIDGVLYYKSRSGVCAYDGTFPSSIGDALGRGIYRDAVGGDALGRYYLCMDDKLYCFDTQTGIWSEEDDIKVTAFCEHKGVLYFTDGKQIYSVDGGTEQNFEWFAETGDMGLGTNEKKYISRIVVRMRLAIDAVASVSISYDSSGVWENIYNADGMYVQTYNINIRPKRCDHFRIRIEGRGECDVYSITKYISPGSIY